MSDRPFKVKGLPETNLDIPTPGGAREPRLSQMLLDLRKEQFNLRFQRATGQIEGVGRLRAVRRDIARVKVLSEEMNKRRENSKE